MKSIEERQSNFELMRIVSMIFIIIYHVYLHSNFNANGLTKYLLILLNSLTYVHVNSYVLVTGYFQCKNKVKLSKVLSLIAVTWFWNVLWMLIFVFVIPKFSLSIDHTITNIEIIKNLLPLDACVLYWFIGTYLILYLISPILNIVVQNTSQKQLKNIILILLIIFSIIPIVTREIIIDVSYGRSLPCFIVLYFIGAYLRNYPIENSKLLKKYTIKDNRKMFVFGYVLFAFLSFLCLMATLFITSNSLLARVVSEVLFELNNNFLSIIVIIQSIFYFLFFKTLNFNSKFINKLSKYTIGVYLVHENMYIRENLYTWLGFSNYASLGPKLIIIIIVFAIFIYILSVLLEMIRMMIFKFFNNIKLLRVIKNKCNYFIEKIELKTNLKI